MTDEQPPDRSTDEGTAAAGAAPGATVRCPWCSTESPAGTATCPSCGAALVASGDAAVPGVTAIDPEAVLRGRTAARGRGGGILGFLVGEGDGIEVPSEAELEKLVPPGTDVRLEIARLEIHAERQRLEAAQAAIAAEAAVKEGDRALAAGGSPDAATMSTALSGPVATDAAPLPGPGDEPAVDAVASQPDSGDAPPGEP